jgi:aspartate kinase
MRERTRPLVLKFGGTSVADADAIGRLIRIVRPLHEQGTPVVLVVSAMSGVTDRLLALASAAERREAETVSAGVAALANRHRDAMRALGGLESGQWFEISSHFDELQALLTATSILRAASPAARDAIASVGELASSRLVAAALERAGIPAAWVDCRRTIVTDAQHMCAVPDTEATDRAVEREIAPLLAAGQVAVAGGFVAATGAGVTTTLGRGGSDYSAAIIGGALDAAEIQIWPDVDGMLTADPRVIDNPRVVARLSFPEASELAYFGAKVLHPSTILPAVAKDIPVRILNSRAPEGGGTTISGAAAGEGPPLAAIACKRGVTMIEITSTRMLLAHGFLHRVFEIFERFATCVDVVTTSEVSVSLTLDDDRRVNEIVQALSEFSEVTVERGLAMLAAVGDRLRTTPRIAARVIGVLGDLPVRMVSRAASRRNVTLVLSDRDLASAMARLHEEFFDLAAPSPCGFNPTPAPSRAE